MMDKLRALVVAAFLLMSATAWAADTDGDGVDDAVDNCIEISNPDQRDTDGDGFGNLCDGDLNNDGVTNAQDQVLFRQRLNSNDPDVDLNGNGYANSQDFVIFRRLLGKPTGPAAPIARPGESRYPLHTETGKTYMVDARGNPFFVNGDTAWSLIVQLDLEDAEQYLEDRRQRGINTVLANLIETTHGSTAPANQAGDGPFLGPDFTNFNEAYFAHAAAIVDIAASKGILLLLAPAYMGYQGTVEGWYPAMGAAGANRLRAYGRYVGSRFAGKDNIMWVHGGDFNPPANGVVLGRAVAEGIIETDSRRRWLHTVHADRNTSALDSSMGKEAWLTTNVIYTSDTNVVEQSYRAWNATKMPFFLFEADYDSGSNGSFIRKMAYQSILSGASGHLIGHHTIWPFLPDWKSYLDSDGASSMPHIAALLTSRAWWLLVPDTGASFLTGGVNPGRDQAPAALASDRSFGVIYTQYFRNLTVNMAQLAGPRATARWFDPANGAYSAISGSPFEANGSRTFSPPRTNSQGSEDWILVLESAP